MISDDMNNSGSTTVELVDFNLTKSYSDFVPVYVIMFHEKWNLCSWKDVYVKVMEKLAKGYERQLIPWSRFGDFILNSNQNVNSDIYKQVTPRFSVRTDYSVDDMLLKIRKYISVCNIDIKVLTVACIPTKENINIQISKVENNENGDNNTSVHNKRQTNNLDDKSLKVISDINAVFDNRIAELKEETLKLLYHDDCEIAAEEFKAIYHEIALINETSEEINTICKQLIQSDDVMIMNVKDNHQIMTWNDLISYFLRLVDAEKQSAINVINNYYGNDDLSALNKATNNIAILSRILEKLNAVKVDFIFAKDKIIDETVTSNETIIDEYVKNSEMPFEFIKYDFSKMENLTLCKPIMIVLKGHVIKSEQWFTLLYEYIRFLREAPNFKNKIISMANSSYPILALFNKTYTLRNPRKIYSDIFIETVDDANRVAQIIKDVTAYCCIPFDELDLYYTDK